MPKPKPEMLGAGMARVAGETAASRGAYLAYAEEEQIQGRKPLPFEEWAKRMKRKPMGVESTVLGG